MSDETKSHYDIGGIDKNFKSCNAPMIDTIIGSPKNQTLKAVRMVRFHSLGSYEHFNHELTMEEIIKNVLNNLKRDKTNKNVIRHGNIIYFTLMPPNVPKDSVYS